MVVCLTVCIQESLTSFRAWCTAVHSNAAAAFSQTHLGFCSSQAALLMSTFPVFVAAAVPARMLLATRCCIEVQNC